MTLNSDDPPMFGTTLTEEYRRAASALGLGRAQLAALAANGVRASFLDSAAKRALLQEIDSVRSQRRGARLRTQADGVRGSETDSACPGSRCGSPDLIVSSEPRAGGGYGLPS